MKCLSDQKLYFEKYNSSHSINEAVEYTPGSHANLGNIIYARDPCYHTKLGNNSIFARHPGSHANLGNSIYARDPGYHAKLGNTSI